MPTTGADRPLRLLAAAPTPESGRPPPESASPKELTPRRKSVKNACHYCHIKKTKCDSKRPSCSRCSTRQLECVYDTIHKGTTKAQSAESEINRLRNAVTELSRTLDILKHGTLDEAQAMLTSIRQGVQNDRNESKSQSQDSLEATTSSNGPPVSYRSPPLLFDRSEWGRGPSPTRDNNEPDSTLDPARSDSEPAFDNLQLQPDNESAPQQSNGFHNLPFSNSILANHYPGAIQQQQHNNVFRPLWSILPLTTRPGASSVTDSVAFTLRQARSLIQSGQSAEEVAGRNCNIAALFDENQYNRTSLLSKWSARLVFSIQHKNRTFSAFAATHLVWILARWMIDPQPETYEAVPEWFRPTMAQLWTPHVDLIDFFIWPTLRDMVVDNPDTLQRDWRWLEDTSRTIDCDWFVNSDLALETDPITGEVRLIDAAKVGHSTALFAEQLANWSVESPARQCIEDMDSVVRVRANSNYSST
ncbi:hypothetical protein SCARD494_04774 [Seiridium cardinale]